MRLLILGLLVLFVLPSLVLADVVIPGEKQIDFCYNITNMDRYPNYVFLVHDTETSGFTLEIELGECFSFYKAGMPWVYAAKKSEYSEEEAREDEYFSSDKIIPSGLQLFGRGSTPIFDPLEKVITNLEIVSLDENKLEIKKIKEINVYKGGITTDNSEDLSLNLYTLFYTFFYILISAVALIVIVLVLILRKK